MFMHNRTWIFKGVTYAHYDYIYFIAIIANNSSCMYIHDNIKNSICDAVGYGN